MSNFKLVTWLPHYLRWWRFAFGTRLEVDEVRAAADRRGTTMSNVLVTGSAGFIGGYVVKELLDRGHSVVGIDNYSKYGPVRRSYDDHPRYRFIEADARDVELMTNELSDVRPLHRRCRPDRRDLLLPHLRLRPAGHQRAHHGLVV